MPEAGFFVCQQHFPENFWSHAAQLHPNGATGVVGLAIADDNPREAATFLSRLLAAEAPSPEGRGYVVEAEGGRIECRPPAELAERYGDRTIRADGPPLALARIAVNNLDATRRALTQGHVAHRDLGGALVVGADVAMGAAYVFEPAG